MTNALEDDVFTEAMEARLQAVEQELTPVLEWALKSLPAEKREQLRQDVASARLAYVERVIRALKNLKD